MRKFTNFLLVLSLSIFTCCFSENQEEIDDSIEIEGNWLVYNGTTFNQMIELSNGSMKLYGCTNLPDGECDVVFWWSFDGDPYLDCQTYSIEDNTFTRTNCVGNVFLEYPTYECDGNKITWRDDSKFNWLRLNGDIDNCNL